MCWRTGGGPGRLGLHTSTPPHRIKGHGELGGGGGLAGRAAGGRAGGRVGVRAGGRRAAADLAVAGGDGEDVARDGPAQAPDHRLEGRLPLARSLFVWGA